MTPSALYRPAKSHLLIQIKGLKTDKRVQRFLIKNDAPLLAKDHHSYRALQCAATKKTNWMQIPGKDCEASNLPTAQAKATCAENARSVNERP